MRLTAGDCFVSSSAKGGAASSCYLFPLLWLCMIWKRYLWLISNLEQMQWGIIATTPVPGLALDNCWLSVPRAVDTGKQLVFVFLTRIMEYWNTLDGSAWDNWFIMSSNVMNNSQDISNRIMNRWLWQLHEYNIVVYYKHDLILLLHAGI